jgi:hypothetical protein
MGLINDYSQPGIGNKILGNIADTVGGIFHIPETGISEFIAGGPTVNSANPKYVWAADNPPATDLNYGPQPLIGPQPNPNLKTGGTPQPQSQPQQQSSSGNYMDYYQGWDANQAQQDFQKVFGGDINKLMTARGVNTSGSGGGVDPNEAIRNQLSSSWDSYFRSLDDQYNALPGKEQDMQGIARNSYDQSVRDIGFEQENNQALLDKQYRKNEENQVRSLQDIADNIRNLYRSGNIYLGSRGAGDSSAANQYSYAVTKLGSKQRGDVLNQTRSIQNDIADREAQLGRTVMSEKAKIKTDFDNKVLEISTWLKDAQEQVKQARANGELQKGQSLAQLSQDIYNQATNRLLQLENNATERTNALVSWATSNSANINQLKANLKEVSNITATNPTFSQLSGSPQVDAQGNMRTYWSQTKDEDKRINGGY